MKTYFCFIENFDDLSRESKIFKVAVGTDWKSQSKRQLIDLFACDNGHLWRVWDEDTDNLIKEKLNGRCEISNSVVLGLQVVWVEIHVLYRAIIDGETQSLINPPHVVRNFIRLFSLFSPKFYSTIHQSKVIHRAIPRSRKYLSQAGGGNTLDVGVAYGIMIFLFLLGAFIEGLERNLL